MEKPIENFWHIRMTEVKTALEANNFEVFLAENKEDACRIVLEDIIPQLAPKTVSWGGSMTFRGIGLYQALSARKDLESLDTFDDKASAEEKDQRRRQALHSDLFFTGTNAVTEAGQLVNLDMIGNRVGALTYGPKWVVVVVGRNKIVPDLEEAMFRIKNYAAPANSMRLDKKTPCVKTAYCEECKSPDRICNTWTITEKSFPKGRVKVVLINEDWGL
jgi:L-lactate utilization protein LutB